jgi:cytochrome c oxidase subunit 2
VFERIFEVFLGLGTVVGVVVIGYMLYNAYKYRDGDDGDAAVGTESETERPRLGELPTGSGGGKKLFTSFFLSTIVVVSLIGWTYGTLLFVEEGPSAEESIVVEVEGFQFGWEFTYPNGHTTDTLRVPVDRPIRLRVTSRDVFHNFGIPAMKVKSDAIPGERTQTWFIAEETGTYTAQCYELCGAGHSYMTAPVVVMEPDEYEAWYAGTEGTQADTEPDVDEGASPEAAVSTTDVSPAVTVGTEVTGS